ncbi:MAG: ELP5 family protein [Thermoplasmata archaeon]|nr:ELP5 family protein [Thermoplasmata archaeon]
MTLAGRVASELEQMPPSSAVSLQVGVDYYLDAIRAVVDIFSSKRDVDVIYITATISYQAIVDILKALEIDASKVHFVDCISHTMMGASMEGSQVLFVESPTMLENIMLKTEYLMRKSTAKEKLVLIDSVNTLAIHNSNYVLSEFLHIFVSSLRSKNVNTLILTVIEHTTPELNNMVNLVSDSVIRVKEEEEGQR